MTEQSIETVTERVYQIMTRAAAIPDPSVKEIIRELEKPTLSEVSDDGMKHWRRYLKHVSSNLQEFPATSGAHLVTKTYYEDYRAGGQTPTTAEQAKECVCTGELAYGIRIPGTSGADAIRLADIVKNLESASGKMDENSNRALTSTRRNEISTEQLLQSWEQVRASFEQAVSIRRELQARGVQPDAPLFSDQGGDGAKALQE